MTAGFPLQRTKSFWQLNRLSSGRIVRNNGQDTYMSSRGSECKLSQKVSHYKFRWATNYSVEAELCLKPFDNRTVIDGPVNATVRMGRKTFQVAVMFSNHFIVSMSCENDVGFDQKLQKSGLIGRSAANAVHDFLVKEFWGDWSMSLIQPVTKYMPLVVGTMGLFYAFLKSQYKLY